MGHGDFLQTIDEILARPAVEPDESKGNYDLQYRAMSVWFDQKRVWDSLSVIQGSLMVFGWMPTILEGRTRREFVITQTKAAEIATALNAGDADKIDKGFINRSPVGTSKFLHFWRPDYFAIWDSNVCWALTGSDRRTPEIQAFNEYTAAIRVCAERHSLKIKDLEQRLFWVGRDAKNRYR